MSRRVVAPEPRPAVTTPCIRSCQLDPVTSLCRGCGRTLDEIAGWGALDEAARRAVMRELPRRLAALPAADPGKGGP